MSFNSLSIAKLGIGFGAIAVASIGLLSPEVEQAQDQSGGLLMVHNERTAKVQQYQKLLAAQKKAIEENPVEAPVEVPALLKPPEQLVINETALRYTQDALSLTDETQKLDISPELVAKLASIRQVAIEQVDIPEIAPDHLAMIRNNDDALAMILIYWAAEEDA